MALEIRQVQKLAQQLVMTPQLQQAIKLLQLSRVELEEMVSKSCRKTPRSRKGRLKKARAAEQPRSEIAGEVRELSGAGSQPRAFRSRQDRHARLAGVPRYPLQFHARISYGGSEFGGRRLTAVVGKQPDQENHARGSSDLATAAVQDHRARSRRSASISSRTSMRTVTWPWPGRDLQRH